MTNDLQPGRSIVVRMRNDSDNGRLYIINALSARTGGGLTYVASVIGALKTQLSESERLVILAAPWNYSTLSSYQDSKVSVERIGVPNTPLRLLYEQFRLPTRFRGSVIYCPGNLIVFMAAFRSLLILQNSNLFEETPANLPLRPKLKLWLQKAVCQESIRRAGAVVVISESIAERVGATGAARRSLNLIQSGRPVLPDQGVAPNGVRTGRFGLILGNDYVHKHTEDAIEAWLKSTCVQHRVGLVVAGDFAARRQVELASSLSPAAAELLQFLGPVSDRREISWLLENASFLISASRIEAHPLTPAEAGIKGCPLVLSDIAPHRETATSHAHYFPSGNTDAAAEAIDETFDENRTPWESGHSWEDHAATLLGVLHRVAAKQLA